MRGGTCIYSCRHVNRAASATSVAGSRDRVVPDRDAAARGTRDPAACVFLKQEYIYIYFLIDIYIFAPATRTSGGSE